MHTLKVLEKQFGVSFIERSFPDKKEMIEQRSSDQIEALLASAEIAICDGFLPQAKAILEHENAQQIVAFLLKNNAQRIHDQHRSRANKPEPQRSRPSRGKPRGSSWSTSSPIIFASARPWATC